MFGVPSGFFVAWYSSSSVPVAPELVGSGTDTIHPSEEKSVCWAGSGVEDRVAPSEFRSWVRLPLTMLPADGHVVIAERLFTGLMIQPTSDSRKVARVG